MSKGSFYVTLVEHRQVKVTIYTSNNILWTIWFLICNVTQLYDIMYQLINVEGIHQYCVIS